uniref:Ribosomal protein L20 n=1 Tax=Riquetophycus sp. HSY-2014a TaxID=1488470 RepID=A0A0E3DAY7_9FLOR|nr:ribosomal protein L20 [Riquetophycus sp. HSY-2014a]
MFINLKKEFKRTKSRKLKKQDYKRSNKQISSNIFAFNLFVYFTQRQKIFLNRKILKNTLLLENGSLFSLKNWIYYFYKNNY